MMGKVRSRGMLNQVTQPYSLRHLHSCPASRLRNANNSLKPTIFSKREDILLPTDRARE
jgi:hypothetical protein